MSIINKRINFGRILIVPTGRRTRIGTATKGARRVARIDEYGPSKSVTLLVGQNKGKEERNRKGRCAAAPSRVRVETTDRVFLQLRRAQVGEDAGANRQIAKGWFHAKPEASVIYEVVYIPTKSEPTFASFRRNMNHLAEQLAERLCQDSVIILRDDSKKREAAAAVWEPRRGKRW